MSGYFRDVLARSLQERVARDEQVAADEQHRVGPVEIEHLVDAFERHPAGRDRQGGTEAAPRRAGPLRQSRALLARIREAAAVVGEDRRIRTEQAEEAPE